MDCFILELALLLMLWNIFSHIWTICTPYLQIFFHRNTGIKRLFLSFFLRSKMWYCCVYFQSRSGPGREIAFLTRHDTAWCFLHRHLFKTFSFLVNSKSFFTSSFIFAQMTRKVLEFKAVPLFSVVPERCIMLGDKVTFSARIDFDPVILWHVSQIANFARWYWMTKLALINFRFF